MKLEETVIVNVSMLGLAESGQGSSYFSIEIPGDFMGNAEIMHKAFTSALAEAMTEFFPSFQDYTRKKYGAAPPDLDSSGSD